MGADVNGDGKLGVLLGDSTQLIKRVDGISDQDYAQKEKTWSDKQNELEKVFAKEQKKVAHLFGLKEVNDEQNDEQNELLKQWHSVRENFSKHYQSRSEFITEKSTGHVWLFIAK